jgi:hypothetical protein
MTAAEILAHQRRRPFRPFRLVTTGEMVYRINHPDQLWVTVGTAYVGYPDQHDPPLVARYDIVDLRHIVRLEVEEPIATQGPDIRAPGAPPSPPEPDPD